MKLGTLFLRVTQSKYLQLYVYCTTAVLILNIDHFNLHSANIHNLSSNSANSSITYRFVIKLCKYQPYIQLSNTVSVLGQDEGYTVKYCPLPEGDPEGKAQGNSQKRRAMFDLKYRVES